jgi:hypothetical protein
LTRQVADGQFDSDFGPTLARERLAQGDTVKASNEAQGHFSETWVEYKTPQQPFSAATIGKINHSQKEKITGRMLFSPVIQDITDFLS